jgi:hypothetical protein
MRYVATSHLGMFTKDTHHLLPNLLKALLH